MRVKYYSLFEASGYGSAAIAYVRGLLNAGVALHWIPLLYRGGERVTPLRAGDDVPLLSSCANDAALRDLPALLAATSRAIACDTVIVHTAPELWPDFFEAGRRNVGYTVWEADALPPHWVPRMNRADRILVPWSMNRPVVTASGVRPPVFVVPHIRRHAWNEFAPSMLDALRTQLGIPQDHFVFYTIASWSPRKALPLLLQAFIRAFTADEPVSLLVKTSPMGYGEPPFYPEHPSASLAKMAVDAAGAELGRKPPSICLLPYELDGRGIDLLHELGDCYVSLAHGEGWALPIFDAASRGTPVVATGWGGHLDYLGADWPGAIAYRLGTVPILPPDKPSFWPPQRWALPQFDAAVAALQQAYTAPEPARAAAVGIEETISNRYAEPVVIRTLLDALNG